jgi:hypothetical protein
MTLIFKASSKQLTIAVIQSGLSLTFGIALFLFIPLPIRYLMLLICGFAAVIGPITVIYDRLEFTDRAVSFRSIFRRWSLPLSEIQDWKIKGNDRSPSLHFSTTDGRQFCVPGLEMLGVRDQAVAARSIAKCLRQYRRENQ